MVDRRTFVAATTLFPILTACGGGSNNASSVAATPGVFATGTARFTAGTDGNFALDGKPFLMAAGELHPGRIPYQYWDQRIKMVKSMGFNTISLYDFWSMHETDFDPAEGPKFDFETAERNLPHFIDLCKENNMWVFLRPGPFVDAFWDLGGIPGYMLKNDKVVLRSSTDRDYMDGVARYIKAIAPLIIPRLSSNGGPIIMVQVENEYTSFARDAKYVKAVRYQWQINGIGMKNNVLLSTNGSIVDGVVMNDWTGLVDQPIGGDPLHVGDKAIAYAAHKQPIFGAENYSGWDTLSSSSAMYIGTSLYYAQSVATDIKGLLAEQSSFAIYVACGGTSFEYGAAGVYDDVEKFTFDANVTSYDYRAPINEQGSRALNLPDADGNLTMASYDAIKSAFASELAVKDTPYSLKGPLDAIAATASTKVIPVAPAAYPMIALASADMPITSLASIWDNLPPAITSTAGPLACEQVGMYSGCGIVYQTTLAGVSGLRYITLEKMADVASVFVDGTLVAIIDRRPKPGIALGTATPYDNNTYERSAVVVDFGTTVHDGLLEIFVYTFGHSHKQFTGKSGNNFRKGIWGSVFISPEPSPTTNYLTIINWNMYPLPMAATDVPKLKAITALNMNRAGKFFSSKFNVSTVGDSYVDLSTWNLGTVWVNGHNLGRHSARVGPQNRWYCPGVWLKQGGNELVIFDTHITNADSMKLALLDTPNVY